jgi:hypothetical protein
MAAELSRSHAAFLKLFRLLLYSGNVVVKSSPLYSENKRVTPVSAGRPCHCVRGTTMNLTSYLTQEYLTSFLAWENLKSFITLANAMGVIGGMFYVAATSMKTVIPLRIAGIASAFFFLLYGIFSQAVPSIFLYGLLLPLNSYRLYEMVELIKKVRTAAEGDLSMDWLEPFMTKRKYRKGDVLFHKGDPAEEMFLTVKGKFLVKELNIEISPGHLFGEMGLLTPGNRRTQTVECIKGGSVLTITYDKVRELYFENPEFGFHFLRLTSERLLQNVARLERRLAAQAQAVPG